jgi:hypothetical protein
MQYGDKLESDGRSLPELLGLSIEDLSSQVGMKRGHIARFMDRTAAADQLPKPYDLPPTKATRMDSLQKSYVSVNSSKVQSTRKSLARRAMINH